jgi:hypothetical protein
MISVGCIRFFLTELSCFAFVQLGLYCFQRSGIEAVAGCTGTGSSGSDYCAPAPPGRLVLMGDNGSPAINFPLGRCEGDCDRDADCEVRRSLSISSIYD